MSKKWIVLWVTPLVLLLAGAAFGQYGTLTFRTDISGSGAINDGGTWKIKPNEVTELNLYSNYEGGTEPRITWSSPFLFNGTAGCTNVTWGDTALFGQAPFYSSTYWDMFKRTYAESWDGDLTNDIGNGNLGDLFNFTGIANFAGYPSDVGELKIAIFTVTVTSTSGTFCMNQGDATVATYDWLFDDEPTFDQVCYPIYTGSDVKERNLTGLPTQFALDQNFPNPFNPTTEITFALPTASKTRITVYNALGQVVRTLVDKDMPAGYYSVIWDGNNGSGKAAASGIYFYKIEAGKFQSTKKMMMLK